MFEHHTEPVLTRGRFLLRVLGYLAASAVFIGSALGVGVLGYHHYGQLNWIESLENASMILGGMGPVGDMKTNAGKLFASAYALFSGLVFIGATSLVLAPFVHRILHKLHLDEDQ